MPRGESAAMVGNTLTGQNVFITPSWWITATGAAFGLPPRRPQPPSHPATPPGVWASPCILDDAMSCTGRAGRCLISFNHGCSRRRVTYRQARLRGLGKTWACGGYGDPRLSEAMEHTRSCLRRAPGQARAYTHGRHASRDKRPLAQPGRMLDEGTRMLRLSALRK